MAHNLSQILKGPNGQPIQGEGGRPVTAAEVITASVNQSPAVLGNPTGSNPRHLAELRGGILTKSSDAADALVTYLPEEIDEILSCVGATQTASVYLIVKQFLNSVPEPPDAKKS